MRFLTRESHGAFTKYLLLICQILTEWSHRTNKPTCLPLKAEHTSSGTQATAQQVMLFQKSLEESATDVANELTRMIQTQRAYSSNAKVIQTVDEMLQETTNIIR